MTRLDVDGWPSWLTEIDALLAVHPQFVLSGNVRDRYWLPGAEPQIADQLREALWLALGATGYSALLSYDIVDGYTLLSGDAEAAWADVHALTQRDLRSADPTDLTLLAEVIRAFAVSSVQNLAFVVDYASRLTRNPNELDPRQQSFFSSALKSSHEAVPTGTAEDGSHRYCAVFWVVEREHDLPAWLTAGNRSIRSIPIPWPELAERELVAGMLLRADLDTARAEAAAEIAARTDGMAMASLFDIVTLMSALAIAPEDAEDAVRVYKLGTATSPWRQDAASRRIRGHVGVTDDEALPAEERLAQRVRGQGVAVTKTVDILKRAVLGLSGAQSGPRSSRPRGVLFFAGPTGVGKTELAKAVAELVFGSEDAYIRFDMSEFSSEHAGDRLVGAPPGYVGFEGGGELTNAVRLRPYSLILFDEIEKAHPRILDKFLQLLDDGRLTDGRGTTVHFSDTIIVFTSNLGMTRPADSGEGQVVNVHYGEAHATIESKVLAEIRRYFTEDLNRPELLNRVGDNVVVFDFIRSDVAVEITDLMVQNIIERAAEASEAVVRIDARALEQLRALTTADLTFGGRGIGNVLESRFVNPLARSLFERDLAPGAVVTITDVGSSDIPEVRLA